ncbi:hypothetical protein HZS_377, partial [Henneguya salminicola]
MEMSTDETIDLMNELNLEFNNEDVNNLIASYEERISNEYSIEQEKSMEIKNERKDEDHESIVK